MRVIFKIFSILFALYILSILFVSPAKAACSEDAYGNCTGTCNCASYGLCGSCSCKWQSDNYCGATGCSPCPTNTPGGGVGTSPTVTPAGGCWCQNGKCVGNLTKCTYTVSGCNTTCSDPTKNANIEEYCTTTNQTCGIKTCAGYSASCVTTANCNKNAPGCGATPVPADCAYNAPGCNICGYARTEAIYCNGVHCGDTCVPHALCSNSPWCSGSGNPTNTTAPTATPTATPTPTRTPTPTPTPNPHWIKLKNTSFSSPHPLTQPIPASPVAFDADDDASSPYFIIASCF
jgi:hypothetical protein